MKNNSYWVSISDLMSGVVGVLILFFVMAILSIVGSQIAAEQQKQKMLEESQKGAYNVVQKLSEKHKNNKDIEFFPEEKLIRLADTSFTQGSACISNEQKILLQQQISPEIINELSKNRNLSVQIEGHTDVTPVGSRGYSNYRACAPFDDNYTLSAGRAREARNALFSSIDRSTVDWMKRVSVVGYGADRLIDTKNPESAQNRRVEIRFINLN